MQALLDLEAHDLPRLFIQHYKREPAWHPAHTLSADKDLLRRKLARVLQGYRWLGRDNLSLATARGGPLAFRRAVSHPVALGSPEDAHSPCAWLVARHLAPNVVGPI